MGVAARQLATGVATVVLVVAYSADFTGLHPRSAAAAVVALFGSVVLHELGHVVTARLAGTRVTGVRLGVGPRLTPKTWRLDLRPVITSGLVTRSGLGTRGWQLANLMSGLLVNTALLVAGVTVLALHGRSPVACAVVVANALLLLTNAIPSRGHGGTDGYRAWVLLRGLAHPYATGIVPPVLTSEVDTILRLIDTHGTTAAVQRLAMEPKPRQPGLRIVLSVLLVEKRHWQAASAFARRQPDGRFGHVHMFAEAEGMDMALGGPVSPERVAEATEAAERAVALFPTGPLRPATRHSLALVRLADRRWEEAASLCAECLPEVGPPGDRAAVLATEGLARLRSGDRTRARELLGEARDLHDGDLVQALARELDSAPPPAG